MIMLLSNLGQYKMKTMYSSNTDVIVVPETLRITKKSKGEGKDSFKKCSFCKQEEN